jgi:hypothetical protein
MGTLSLSNDFYLTAGQIVAASLRKIGVLGQGQTATTYQVSEGLEALNAMVLGWQAYGVFLWKVHTTFTFLTVGTYSYQMGSNCLGLESMLYRTTTATDSIDYPVERMTQAEYEALTDKFGVSGRPTHFVWYRYHDAASVPAKFIVWPTPDVADTLIVKGYYRVYDNDSTSDQPDFLPEWSDALIYGLAYRLAPEYGIPMEERKVLQAESAAMWKLAFEGTSRETGSMRIGPAIRSCYGNL